MKIFSSILLASGCILAITLILNSSFAEAGGKGKGKGGSEDIILYKGNIVLRGGGEKKGGGGSIVVANADHGHHEHVEMDPMSYFMPFMGGSGGGHHHGHHGMGGHHMRR